MPPAFTPAFQMHYAAQWGANVTVRKYSLATLRAFELKEIRMLQGAAHEGAQPHRIRSNLGHPAAAVGHFQVKGNEVEPVNVFPLVKAGIDFRCVLVEQLGVEQLLLRRTPFVCLEEIVLFHGTDFF